MNKYTKDRQVGGKVAADLAIADHFLYEKRVCVVEKPWKGGIVPDLWKSSILKCKAKPF